jgi:hypothetical protein
MISVELFAPPIYDRRASVLISNSELPQLMNNLGLWARG